MPQSSPICFRFPSKQYRGGVMASSTLDRVYQELVSEIRLLHPSCRSRAPLPPEDLVAFLQRLSLCQPRDRALVVVEAPEVRTVFLPCRRSPKVQGTDGLNQAQLQVIDFLCDNSVGKQVPLVVACRKAPRTGILHYNSNEVSVGSTVKLRSKCAKEGWWDIAKLIVCRLCAHPKATDLGVIEQKVLGTLRDSLVEYAVWANFTCKEARDWISRYDMKIKTWRNNLIEQLRTDLKMLKA